MTTGIIVAGVALQAFFVLAHGINKELLGDGTFFALDADASMPSWATVVLFALAGTVSGLLAWLQPGLRRPFAALAVFGLLLSLEQTVQVHTEVENNAGDNLGPLVEAVVGLGFVAALAMAARAIPRPFGWFLWLAIAAIATAAGASLMNQAFDLPYVGVIFFQTLEEVSEMLTATLILAAVAEPLLGATAERLRGETDGQKAWGHLHRT